MWMTVGSVWDYFERVCVTPGLLLSVFGLPFAMFSKIAFLCSVVVTAFDLNSL